MTLPKSEPRPSWLQSLCPLYCPKIFYTKWRNYNNFLFEAPSSALSSRQYNSCSVKTCCLSGGLSQRLTERCWVLFVCLVFAVRAVCTHVFVGGAPVSIQEEATQGCQCLPLLLFTLFMEAGSLTEGTWSSLLWLGWLASKLPNLLPYCEMHPGAGNGGIFVLFGNLISEGVIQAERRCLLETNEGFSLEDFSEAKRDIGYHWISESNIDKHGFEMRSVRQVTSAETLGKLPNFSGFQVFTCEMIIVTLPH